MTLDPPDSGTAEQQADPGDQPERPDIAGYTDYRAFLRALVAFIRKNEPGFSFRTFAKRAGFGSPNYLKLVTDGQRNLSAESVDKFGRGLGMPRRELEVFRILVAIANARSDEEKNQLFVRLRERVAGDKTARLRDDQFAVYDVWWALVIRDMVQLPDFEMDPRWIARRLRPRIRVAQAQRAVELLLRLGLVGEHEGKLKATEATISTGPEVASLAVRNYHRALLEVGIHALDEVPKEERNITSVTAVLTEEGYAEAVAEIGKLRKKLLQISERCVQSAADQPTQVYSGVFSIVPVTQTVRDRRNAGSNDPDPDLADEET